MPDIFVAGEKKDPPTGEAREILQDKKDLPADEAGDKSTRKKLHFYLFHSFLENPEGVDFEDIEEDEKILLFLRRHFITNVHWISVSIILLIIPFFLFSFSSHFSFLGFLDLPTRFIVVLTIFYYLIVITYFFVNYITWYFNIALITNKRVIDVNFADLVYKNVSATKINLIQDASYKQVGVIQSFFDFGEVLLQTAGTVDNFIFEFAGKPEKVVQIVERLIGTEKRSVGK